MVWDLETLERLNEEAELKARVVALNAQITTYEAALETSSDELVSKFLESKIRGAKSEHKGIMQKLGA